MHPIRFLTLLLLIATSLLLLAADGPLPPAPAPTETQAELSAALTRRLQANAEARALTFDLFTPELDTAFTSPDGKTAVLWLALRDDYGRLLATEPGLALAYLSDEGWQVLLPGDPGWEETFDALPEGMLPLELAPAPEGTPLDSNATTGPLTGYFLPYAAGTSRWLEGSISHFQYIPELGYPSCSEVYCRYAYDLTDVWHYPLLASKGGTVYASRDSCTDGSPSCTNYIVLRNASEGTYQIYLHLAHGTIPDKLTPGTAVKRGQYLSDTDDTGYSTSQHVHFMVTDSIWLSSGSYPYYWGRSIDIRFADVPINNGIPRTCYEVTQFPIYDGATECLGDRSDPRNPANDWFVSGNVGAYPPTGAFITPAPGATVAGGYTPLMDVTVTASDDVRLTALRLVAKLNGKWVEIGPKITTSAQSGLYDWDVNLCNLGPLNGPLEVALRAWDHEGNTASLLDPRTVQVDHACPPPTSQLKPAESFDSTALRLGWEGTSSGAGIGSFDLQWRTVPGSWDEVNLLNYPISQQSTWFAGQPGGTYEFRVRARDENNQPEPWPAEADLSVTLPDTCVPDPAEPDDDRTQATTLALGAAVQHNLCGAGDPDWFQVEAENAGYYLVSAPSQYGGAAVRITVYAGDGETVLASSQASGVGQGTAVVFQAAAGGYYIKTEPLYPYLMGTQALYGFSVWEGKVSFLPLMSR